MFAPQIKKAPKEKAPVWTETRATNTEREARMSELQHTARPAWTFAAVDARGGLIPELDIKAECSDGRTELLTLRRWFNTGWRVPTYMNLNKATSRICLSIARELEDAGAIA